MLGGSSKSKLVVSRSTRHDTHIPSLRASSSTGLSRSQHEQRGTKTLVRCDEAMFTKSRMARDSLTVKQ